MIKELKFSLLLSFVKSILNFLKYFILILQVELKICQEKPILEIYGLNYLNMGIGLERKMISLDNAVSAKDIDVSDMGESALKSHAGSKKHQSRSPT